MCGTIIMWMCVYARDSKCMCMMMMHENVINLLLKQPFVCGFVIWSKHTYAISSLAP